MIDFKKIEQEMLEFWKKNQIYEKLLERKAKERFFLLDGPPYANGTPHIGHVKNTVFKDIVIRTEFMKSKQVLFQPGFDTHGLPIENMVEKKLNLGSKKEIEKFGISKFMAECKKNAALNVDLWLETYRKLGSLYVLKKPYLTYEDNYIESGWWAFHQMYKKGMVYHGEKPVMWCPHCETSLAGYEVTDSYKDVKDPGVYILFNLTGTEDHLLVYTTTPWTLPANVAVAVAPKEKYVKVEVGGKKIILGEQRLSKLSEMGFGYNVLESFEGKKLVGKQYEPLLNVPLQIEMAKGKLGKSHEVIASIPLLKERVSSKVKAKKNIEGKDEDLFEEFVTMGDGTGLVHCAPGHGKTDYLVGQHYKLACVSPVDDQCNMKKESGFSGFVKTADKAIIEKLKEEGKLLFEEDITHSYPLCWRCKAPLIFRLSKQLFLNIEKIKKAMLKENKKVNWLPEFSSERFENWVENAEDWNISRQRYWGIPIPLWKCTSENCGEEKVVEDREELEKLSGKKIADLHSAEEISFKCKKCSSEMKKIKGIVDVWFDSGIAPWASFGYPRNNKDLFEKHFPVDRINEAQDQIRGWFYSLMFCGVGVFSKAPYKTVSMVGWVLDKNGNKMSKSLGNIVDAQQTLDELGADMTRFYFCWDVPPYEVQKFNKDIAKKEIGSFFTILWNLQNLVGNEKLDKNKLDIEDKWILSRLNNTLKNFEDNMNKFETSAASRLLADFVMNDLSRNYIKMTRDKDNSSIVTEGYINILKLLAPICPYLSEKLWQNLRIKKIVQEESVHLSSWPTSDEKSIDKKLEEDFVNALLVIEAGLFQRDKAQAGLKWPLAKMIIKTEKKLSKEIQEIILRQLNVKKLEIKKAKELSVELDLKITPELEAEGFARELSRKIQALRKEGGLVKENEIELELVLSKKLKDLLEKHKQELFIKERTNARKIKITTEKLETKYTHTNQDKIKEEGIEIGLKKL